jgi:hypothetical protein
VLGRISIFAASAWLNCAFVTAGFVGVQIDRFVACLSEH